MVKQPSSSAILSTSQAPKTITKLWDFSSQRVHSHQFPLVFSNMNFTKLYSFPSGTVYVRITINLYFNKVHIVLVWHHTTVQCHHTWEPKLLPLLLNNLHAIQGKKTQTFFFLSHFDTNVKVFLQKKNKNKGKQEEMFQPLGKHNMLRKAHRPSPSCMV